MALIAVTMPVVITSCPANGDAAPLPLDVVNLCRYRDAASRRRAELRGVGVPTEKSTLFLSESKQPPRLRIAAVGYECWPVGAVPSKQLAAP